MVFSSENIMIFSIFSKYQPLLRYYYYLLTFLIHEYPQQLIRNFQFLENIENIMIFLTF